MPTPKTPAIDPTWPASRTEMCRVSDLAPHARNARLHDAEQISQVAASIREFGFTIPILRDESGTVLAGHARLAAAQQIGLDAVPVITARGWSEAKKRAYMLADNQLTLVSEWDPELLKIELADLQSLDVDLAMLGFDEDLDRYLAEMETPDEAPSAATPRPGFPADAPPSSATPQPPGDPVDLQFRPSLSPTLGTKQYTDADLSKEDDRLQKRFEQPRKDPYRAVCPNCAEEFFIDV